MQKAMTIAYEVGENLYLNITNHCPCACTFCIRTMSDGAYGSDPLWLEHEPSLEEIRTALDAFDVAKYKEVVFCGFGEPTERLEVMRETARYLKARGVKCIRLNTNGLSDLIHGRSTAADLEGVVDVVSISLNAGTEEAYLDVTRPKFGAEAFPAMQRFAEDCKAYVPQVMLTVVDVLEPSELAAAKRLAEQLGIRLRIRKFDNAATRR
ncbi:TIGR04100 family radical SAM protein [Ruminococcus sp.]|uniref:TIGR04100 family radical SAM protein n=1 Tax=Ruminococcus sp. TaxID=41978 RepID=UPI0025D106D3|nr:TIGR04100 family radical SAM protein [Ruminococcus sp.]